MTADALDLFIEQRDQLPKRCPSWCVGGHEQALEEGNDLKTSSRHDSADLVVTAFEANRPRAGKLRQPLGSIDLCLRAAHRPEIGHWDHPFIEIDVTRFLDDKMQRVSVHLTSGEARTLARQLTHLADLDDLT